MKKKNLAIHAQHKAAYLATICCLMMLPALGQITDYNKIILPSEVDSVPFVERLVQLAWQNNPTAHQSEINQNISALEMRKAKRAWLDNVQIVGNLNEGNINPTERASNLFFPRYNFGLQLNLGRIAATPVNAKIAVERKKLSDEEANAEKIRLRALVSRLHAEYQLAQELTLIQNEITEDAYADFMLAEERFKTGELPIEQYNAVLKIYNTERVRSIQARHEFLLAKINLEEVVGLPLEEIQWP